MDTKQNVTHKTESRNKLAGLWSLILIGIIIFSIFLVVIIITKLIIVPIDIGMVPLAQIHDKQLLQNIYLNPIDTLLKQNDDNFKERAYVHPKFYNPISINNSLKCISLNNKLLNIKSICMWLPVQQTLAYQSKECILYLNTLENTITCK